MDCPACGSGLKQHVTKKDVLFLLCSKWPKCNISGTPTLMNRFQYLRDEVNRLESRLKESRLQVSRLLKKMEKAARDKTEVEPIAKSRPTAIGEMVGPVAELRVFQSRFNAAKTDEERFSIREDAQRMVETIKMKQFH